MGNITRIIIPSACPAEGCPVFMIGKPVRQVITVKITYKRPAPSPGFIFPWRNKAITAAMMASTLIMVWMIPSTERWFGIVVIFKVNSFCIKYRQLAVK